MNLWPFSRREPRSTEARDALLRSQHSMLLASDLANRSACVSKELKETLDRNHIAATLEQTMTGVRFR